MDKISLLNSLEPCFFEEIIAKASHISNENIIITSAIIEPATGKFDNFISDIFRLTIGFQVLGNKDQTIDVILKVSFDVASEIKQLSIFAREQLMYEDMIASFERIWQKNGYPDVIFAPKCFQVTENPYEIIVLEDLKRDKYQMMSKRKGLDILHSKYVLSKLAKLHAASAVHLVKNNKVIDHCFDRVATHIKYSADSPIMMTMKTLYNKLIDVAKTLKVSRDCIKRMLNWHFDDLLESYFVVANPMKCGFRVLVHGDLWVNNILFKHDCDGNPLDTKFLDYQISFWGTPNADLIYFLFSSVSDDVKVKHFDEIIEYYYKELRKTLKLLQYNDHIPSIEELKEDLMMNKMYANQLFLHIIPVTRNCSSITLDIKDLFSGALTDETLNSVFMDENCLKVMGSWLPFMYEKGFI